MTEQLSNNIQNHRAINIGDIFKDADATSSPIRDKNILSELIKIIVKGNEEIKYSKDHHNFKELKKFIENLILPEVKKYSYSDLPSIPESFQSISFDDPSKISRENRNILPANIKYFFIDAAMNHKDYKNKDLTEDKVVETFASFMDPANRSIPKYILLEPDLEFLKNHETNIAYISLNEYGFDDSCYVKLLKGSTKKHMYIEIGLKNLLLQCKINRIGTIQSEDFVFKNNGTDICYYDDVKNIFFKGNPEKNKYINDYINNPNYDKKNISIMLLLLKELGDTMQAIILEKILKEISQNSSSKLGDYLGSSCLLTNDTVLATRCSMLSVPFLLKHNYILTSYQPPINDKDKEIVQQAYDKNQKLQEIERILLNNNGVINGLKEFLNKFFNETIKSIKLSSQTGEFIKIKNRHATNDFINNIIEKIEDANKKLNDFSLILKNQLQNVRIKFSGVSDNNKYEIFEISNAEFYIFRTYIYQLNSIRLLKRIDINADKLIAECYGSTSKTYLFKTKIPKKLHDDTRVIDTDFLLIDDNENQIFEEGFMKLLKNTINITEGGASGKNSTSNTSSTSNNISGENIYIKVYPYIYCYPWFIEYILDIKNYDTIKIFLQELIHEDEVKNEILNKIFLHSIEDKYYKLNLYNNINNINNSILHGNKLNLYSSIKNINNSSLLQKFINYFIFMIKQNTNKLTLRRTRSEPNYKRVTKKKSKSFETLSKITLKRKRPSSEEKTPSSKKKTLKRKRPSSEEKTPSSKKKTLKRKRPSSGEKTPEKESLKRKIRPSSGEKTPEKESLKKTNSKKKKNITNKIRKLFTKVPNLLKKHKKIKVIEII
jgi:hypothetical protein